MSTACLRETSAVRAPLPGRSGGRGVQQGAQAREGADHVLAVDRDVQHGAEHVEQETDVGLAPPGTSGISPSTGSSVSPT